MRFRWLAAAAVLVVGCPDSGPPLLPVGYECTANTDCEQGLTCLPYAVRNVSDAGSSCDQSSLKTCTVICSANSDCTHWGVNFGCLALCDNSSSYCGRTN
jgi:hypothetical protein